MSMLNALARIAEAAAASVAVAVVEAAAAVVAAAAAEAAAARLASAPAAIAITEAARCRHRAHAWILTRIIILCATSLGATSVVIFLAQFSSKVAIEYIHQLRGGGRKEHLLFSKALPAFGPLTTSTPVATYS